MRLVAAKLVLLSLLSLLTGCSPGRIFGIGDGPKTYATPEAAVEKGGQTEIAVLRQVEVEGGIILLYLLEGEPTPQVTFVNRTDGGRWYSYSGLAIHKSLDDLGPLTFGVRDVGWVELEAGGRQGHSQVVMGEVKDPGLSWVEVEVPGGEMKRAPVIDGRWLVVLPRDSLRGGNAPFIIRAGNGEEELFREDDPYAAAKEREAMLKQRPEVRYFSLLASDGLLLEWRSGEKADGLQWVRGPQVRLTAFAWQGESIRFLYSGTAGRDVRVAGTVTPDEDGRADLEWMMPAGGPWLVWAEATKRPTHPPAEGDVVNENGDWVASSEPVLVGLQQ